MKTLITIFSIVVISLSGFNSPESTASVHEDVVQNQLTFDGYEGGYYFFTNTNQQAVVLEADEETKSPDLINGNLEGKTFKVVYTPVERTATSSTQGIIETVRK
ncbi:hypothetical protein ACFSYG_03555 [Leeuwenhoekiella polynyae]|uniref:Uncharacterized protein n=1 Tax=Leeuwenhoekiella polynyae TaxID=1550906 RepID=A0A4Q0PI30_9FLAO|nr:hypothetical protein [Leeuwenhoekiella polynyae]RXG26625.1 hypothetical protein DSM02_625 [Leeuwenhoekiella polynyae]|tara:strand:+ start:264 stop:575 length:312 start_codon:yes stop_codon:yes gene_type:complete